MKFFTHRVFGHSTGDFSQKSFPATFGDHLEFRRNMQKRVYLGNRARWSNFDEIFEPQAICRVCRQLFPKIVFHPLLAGILNFLVKRQKDVYLGNGVRYSEFNNIFDPQGICRVYWGLFAKQLFPATFGGHLEFLHKMQKRVYLGNGAS